MAVRLTLDIFSGRTNPQVVVGGNQERDLLNRLRPGRALSSEDRLDAPAALGYRGIQVELLAKGTFGLPRSFRVANGDLIGEGLGHKAADENFEDFACGSTGPFQYLGLGRRFGEHMQREINRYLDLRERWRVRKVEWPSEDLNHGAPRYEPAWWNNDEERLRCNNSYNYAANYRTDTLAQPGLASAVNHNNTCATVVAAAVADGFVDAPTANNRSPDDGHLVALVMSPGWDYHWYRQERNGYWSHKIGSGGVTNIDNSGHAIRDPRDATRGMYGQFCTFMIAKHGHIKLAGAIR
jgi:hypothetical protein